MSHDNSIPKASKEDLETMVEYFSQVFDELSALNRDVPKRHKLYRGNKKNIELLVRLNTDWNPFFAEQNNAPAEERILLKDLVSQLPHLLQNIINICREEHQGPVSGCIIRLGLNGARRAFDDQPLMHWELKASSKLFKQPPILL